MECGVLTEADTIPGPCSCNSDSCQANSCQKFFNPNTGTSLGYSCTSCGDGSVCGNVNGVGYCAYCTGRCLCVSPDNDNFCSCTDCS